MPHAPRDGADSEAPMTTYQVLPQTQEDSKPQLLPGTSETRNGNGPVLHQVRLDSAMMDQGEQVDFLTELHSQPPVSVSFKDSHKHTMAPSPAGEKQMPIRSGD